MEGHIKPWDEGFYDDLELKFADAWNHKLPSGSKLIATGNISKVYKEPDLTYSIWRTWDKGKTWICDWARIRNRRRALGLFQHRDHDISDLVRDAVSKQPIVWKGNIGEPMLQMEEYLPEVVPEEN